MHSYVEEVTNSYGYTSSAEYDFSFGQVLKSIDINGNEISYELDNLGRVDKITGPYEKAVGAPYTIDFIYHHDAETPWAQTNHYDPAHPGNDLVTAIFVDGLGRVLQTKKDAAIFQKDGAPDEEQMIASGRVFFDALGRTTKAYYPVIDASGAPGDTRYWNRSYIDILRCAKQSVVGNTAGPIHHENRIWLWHRQRWRIAVQHQNH